MYLDSDASYWDDESGGLVKVRQMVKMLLRGFDISRGVREDVESHAVKLEGRSS